MKTVKTILMIGGSLLIAVLSLLGIDKAFALLNSPSTIGVFAGISILVIIALIITFTVKLWKKFMKKHFN